MAITLYELAGRERQKKFSPHCWKARLALIHKGLDFTSEPVLYHEIKSTLNFADYSLLPVLTDDSEVVTDSWDIASYLETRYPEKPLFHDEAGKALAESINQWCDSVLAVHIRPMVLMNIFNLIADEDKDYFRTSREGKLGASLESFSEKADEAAIKFREELDSIREILAIKPFIGGDTPTYADICLLAHFMWIGCVSDREIIAADDSVSPWYQRMLDLYPGARDAVSQ